MKNVSKENKISYDLKIEYFLQRGVDSSILRLNFVELLTMPPPSAASTDKIYIKQLHIVADIKAEFENAYSANLNDAVADGSMKPEQSFL